MLVLALAGCGSSQSGTDPAATAPAKPKRAARPALCGELRMTITGRVDPASNTGELSGLVASRRQPGVLWGIEDSGNTPSLVGLRADGTFLGRYAVTGAENVDWEDVAAAGSDIYAADIGDNLSARAEIAVYRVPEPDASTGGGPTVPATRLTLAYPDGAHDAESLLVDPRTRELIVVTKDFAGPGRVYVAPPERGPAAGHRPLDRRGGPAHRRRPQPGRAHRRAAGLYAHLRVVAPPRRAPARHPRPAGLRLPDPARRRPGRGHRGAPRGPFGAHGTGGRRGAHTALRGPLTGQAPRVYWPHRSASGRALTFCRRW